MPDPSPARSGSATAGRPILTAELLSIGTELTVGETRDTNAGDLARALTGMGVAVGRITALPDDLAAVTDAFRAAIARADLVLSTGGLGPTPDDLTRESIAAAVGEEPSVDPELERWLRELWARRGMRFPEMNLKQAWRLPSGAALSNPNGTAPGWWVERADGGVIVALPGPPREMRPMWTDEVVPRLQRRGVGEDVASRTLRTAGIGESQVADRLGEEMLRAPDPQVATYARSDAVDVRISARGRGPDGSAPSARVDAATARVEELLAGHVWAEGSTSWAEAIGAELEATGGSLAVVEIGTAGSFAALLGDREWVSFTEALGRETPTGRDHASPEGLEHLCRRGCELGTASHGIAVGVRPRGADTAVSIVIVGPDWVQRERHVVFLGGSNGRTRAALSAAHAMLMALRAHRPT